jgi:hypothetical protein
MKIQVAKERWKFIQIDPSHLQLGDIVAIRRGEETQHIGEVIVVTDFLMMIWKDQKSFVHINLNDNKQNRKFYKRVLS